MKINYILPKFPAGREAFAQNDINALVSMGYDVEVFSYRKSNTESSVSCVNVVTSDIRCVLYMFMNLRLFLNGLLFCIKNYSGLKSFVKSLVYMVQSFSFIERYKKHRPDIIHCFWGHYPSILIYLVSKMDKEDSIIKTMFLGAYDLHEQWRGSAHVANKYADIVLTHANANKPKLINLGIHEDKIKVIYRGVDIPKKTKPESPEVKSSIALLSAGALIRDKRHDLSICVAAELLKNDINAVLRIAGQGPEKNNLIRQAQLLGIPSSKIEILGHLNKVALQKAYQQSDYLIALSQHKSECLPNVVKEAMANGCIPIVSNSFAIQELVSDGFNGFVVDVSESSVHILVKKIIDAESLAQKKHELIFNAFKHVSEYFDSVKAMSGYVDAWESPLKKSIQ